MQEKWSGAAWHKWRSTSTHEIYMTPVRTTTITHTSLFDIHLVEAQSPSVSLASNKTDKMPTHSPLRPDAIHFPDFPDQFIY